MITVEYLLPFNTKDGICRDLNAFNSLLSSNVHLSISGNKIRYKGSTYEYSAELNEVVGQNCSVFHVTFGVARTTDKFSEMLRTVRVTIAAHLRDEIQIIWDGVGFEWSKELYPKIYALENSMRKLISKFMLIKLGSGWHESSVPPAVRESIRTKPPGPHAILYESDFIQLSSYLFKPYTLKDLSGMPEILEYNARAQVTSVTNALNHTTSFE